MKPQFKYRSEKTELLDLPIKENYVLKNFEELDFLNKYLGGYSTSIGAIKKFITNRNKTYRIVDLGCGNGDHLKHIAEWASNNDFKVRLTGIDNNRFAIKELNEKYCTFREIKGVESDYKEYLKKVTPPDIILCSLFCHHLNEHDFRQLIFLSKFYNNTIFIINDLVRNRYTYYAAKVFTILMNASVMARHDGPVSVLRSFRREELIRIFNETGIKDYTIEKRWLYRFLIIINAGVTFT